MSRLVDLQYVTACFVLAKMLGVPYVEEKVRDKTLLNQYLRPNPLISEDIHKHTDRTILLGERLFNLQHLNGIQEVLRLLETENLESTFALLAAGEMLYDSHIEIEYVRPTGITGEDYDIHVNAANSEGICCEVKTKTEENRYSETSLSNSLMTARKQLPKNKPGLVMVMVPELWLNDDTVMNGWKDVVGHIFRNSTRIAGVVLFGEQWRFDNDGSAERMLKHIHWENTRSQFGDLILNEVLQKLHPVNRGSRWIPLDHLISKNTTPE